MSPVQAMERSYSALKQILKEGRFLPGARLEANRIAEELGVSMTPVRDVLHRLVGEQMVEASSGEGFHVPRFTEAGLRDLYEWNSALLVIACRTAKGPHDKADRAVEYPETAAERTAMLFERIGSRAPNLEVRAAIASASDRLHPFRILEDSVLEPLLGELDELDIGDSRQSQAIRRYHLRRMKWVPSLLRARGGS